MANDAATVARLAGEQRWMAGVGPAPASGCAVPELIRAPQAAGRRHALGADRGARAADPGLVKAQGGITLVELRARLAEQGIAVAVSALWRFFERHRITPKK